MLSNGGNQDPLDKFIVMEVDPVDAFSEGGTATEIVNTAKATLEVGIPEIVGANFRAFAGPGGFELYAGLIGGPQNHCAAEFPAGIV